MPRFFPLLLALAISLQAQNYPPAQEILASARLQVSQQELDLQGQIREGDRIVPFRLTQTGPTIRYSFTGPDEALQLRLGDTGSSLAQISAEGVEKIAGPEFSQNVRGTGITFEDLALKFIYWPDAKTVGQDYINTRRVWKIELRPSGQQSQYSHVFVWCEQQSGALLRMEGYDGNNRLTKRFEVTQAQTIQGRWFLKQMRIEQFDPSDSRKVRSRSYLEIKK